MELSTTLKSDILAILQTRLNDFIPFAESFGRSRFLVYKSEVHASGEDGAAHEREDAEMEAIANAFRCEIKNDNGRFSLFFYMAERNPGGFLEVVDAGMPAPPVGGDGGIAHNPDGSTYQSKAPVAAYGLPLDGSTTFGRTVLPDYSKEGTGVINEIKTMLKILFHDYFIEAFSDAKSEITTVAKEYVQERIHAAIGG